METNNETIDDIIKDILENDGYCISPTSLFAFDEDGGILLGDLAERIKVAHEREIGELKGERNGLLKANWSFAYDNTRLREENAKLRTLVNELDIALSGSLDIIGNVGEYIQADCGTMLRVETYREILAKAREVSK